MLWINFNLRWIIASVMAMAGFGNSDKAFAEEFYFTTIYGAQRPVFNQARYTHTWASFVKLAGEGSDLRTYRIEYFTISWLAATLEVSPRKLRGEKGVNLTQTKTVEWCEENRMEIAQLGPYQIKPELYSLAMKRWEQLERGELKYRASDFFNARAQETACNCIYSVLDIDGKDGTFRWATMGFGYKGSAFVERRYSKWIVDRERTYPWVNDWVMQPNFPPIRFTLAELLAR